MRWSVKDAAVQIGHHGKILLRGFMKMLYGTAVAGLMGLAAYGFVMIPKEGGYVAVCDFIGSAVTMALAIRCMYAFGGSRKKGKFSSRW